MLKKSTGSPAASKVDSLASAAGGIIKELRLDIDQAKPKLTWWCWDVFGVKGLVKGGGWSCRCDLVRSVCVCVSFICCAYNSQAKKLIKPTKPKEAKAAVKSKSSTS